MVSVDFVNFLLPDAFCTARSWELDVNEISSVCKELINVIESENK